MIFCTFRATLRNKVSIYFSGDFYPLPTTANFLRAMVFAFSAHLKRQSVPRRGLLIIMNKQTLCAEMSASYKLKSDAL